MDSPIGKGVRKMGAIYFVIQIVLIFLAELLFLLIGSVIKHLREKNRTASVSNQKIKYK